jgi:signal transduction histidine kinase
MGKMMLNRGFLLWCIWLLSYHAFATTPAMIKGQTFFFSDSLSQYSLEEIRQIPDTAWQPHYPGVASGTVWSRFRIYNPAPTTETTILSFGEVPYLRLYLQGPEHVSEQYTGQLVPMPERSTPHHKALFKIQLAPGQELQAWLKIDTDKRYLLPESFNPVFKSLHVHQQENEWRMLIQGLFFGIILVMAFYNLALFVAVRDISYLYYVLSIIGIGFYFFFYYGFSLQTIWQNNPVWNAYSFVLIVPLTNMMRIMFTKTYLHTRETLPWMNRFLNLLFILCFVPIIIGLMAFWLKLPWYTLSIDLVGICGTAVLLCMLAAGVLTYLRGYTPALFFILANMLFVVGANMFIIKEMNLVEDSMFTRYAVQFGVISQVVLFSLGLAYRLKKARQEAVAHSLAMERLEREKETERKELVEKQKAELEEKVKERTIALQDKTGQLQATILKLQESEEGLRQLNKIKDKLFSVISHDLRGPVATLDSFINIISKHAARISEEEMDKLSGKTRESVHNLSFLLDNLLNWSRAQMGTFTYQAEPLALQDIVQRNIELYTLNAENKKLNLLSDIPKDIRPFGDRGMVDFIIRNLLSNAIKFTPAYGTIKVLTRIVDGELMISISDTGLGMSAVQVEKVLDPENTYSTTGTAREKGTGLGLMLCQEFLQIQGSRLELSSQKGSGSCFSFRLPLADKTTEMRTNPLHIKES